MKRIVAMLLAALLLLSGCGGESEPAASADLNALYASMVDTLPQMLELDETTMLNFLGIEMADCTQVVAAICAEGLRADEVWLIEAKDEATLEKLHTLAQNRISAKAEETVSYNPEQYAVVEKAQVFTEGNYLFLLVSPDVDGLKALADEAMN